MLIPCSGSATSGALSAVSCGVCVYLLLVLIAFLALCLPVVQIYSKLAGQFGQQAIDNALHSLTSEAHLYTTTGTRSLLQLLLVLQHVTGLCFQLSALRTSHNTLRGSHASRVDQLAVGWPQHMLGVLTCTRRVS
jgi:hypothetical protein